MTNWMVCLFILLSMAFMYNGNRLGIRPDKMTSDMGIEVWH